jgi:hypothetical protein
MLASYRVAAALNVSGAVLQDRTLVESFFNALPLSPDS